MIQASKSDRTLTISERKIEFGQRVNELVVMNDRIFVLLHVSDFAVGDPLVGCNILAFDESGELLQRIPASGATRSTATGREAPEAFFGLWLGDDNKLKTFTPDEFEWDLDPETGKISNPIFIR